MSQSAIRPISRKSLAFLVFLAARAALATAGHLRFAHSQR